jgi:hypothetical protein
MLFHSRQYQSTEIRGFYKSFMLIFPGFLRVVGGILDNPCGYEGAPDRQAIVTARALVPEARSMHDGATRTWRSDQ